MSEKVPDKIVQELKKAAKSQDSKAFGKAIDKYRRDLPEDLLEAREDQKTLKATMKLFDSNLTDVYSEGVKLKESEGCKREKNKKH